MLHVRAILSSAFLLGILANGGCKPKRSEGTAETAALPALSPECRDEQLAYLLMLMIDENLNLRSDEDVRQNGKYRGYDTMRTIERGVSKAFIFADETRENILVAFRGSQNLNDVLANVSIIPGNVAVVGADSFSNGMIHSGFRTTAAAYAAETLAVVQQLRAEGIAKGHTPKLLMSGYSLGGALALLVGWDLAKKGVKPDETVLFGTPRVAMSFRKDYELEGIQTTHYLVRNDPVTQAPLGFEELPGRRREISLPHDEMLDGSYPWARIGASSLKLMFTDGPMAAANLLSEKSREFAERHFTPIYFEMMRSFCADSPQTQEVMLSVFTAFKEYLGRNPTPQELDSRTRQALAGRWTKARLIQEITASDEYHRRWVDQFYRAYLSRPANEEELLRFAGALTALSPQPIRFLAIRDSILAQDSFRTELFTREYEVANRLRITPEELARCQALFRQFGLEGAVRRIRAQGTIFMNDWLHSTYMRYFGRTASSDERTEVSGLVNAYGEEGYTRTLSRIWHAKPFRAWWIGRIYNDALGRDASTADLERWERDAPLGTNAEDLRARVYETLGFSMEYKRRWVRNRYLDHLDREPDSEETIQRWVRRLGEVAEPFEVYQEMKRNGEFVRRQP